MAELAPEGDQGKNLVKFSYIIQILGRNFLTFLVKSILFSEIFI